jgi:hypothetical protein
MMSFGELRMPLEKLKE